MVEPEFDMTIYELQAEISKTMAHPIRLALLHCLKDEEKTVNDLAVTIGASQSNVSQHLALLRQRQIVKTRKAGSNIFYRVASPKITQACDMVRQVLLEQLTEKQKIARSYHPESVT